MKKETAPLYLVRRGHFLEPDMALDARAIAAIPEGAKVRVEIKKPRNDKRLRAYWAMLNDVVAATNCAPSVEKLHDVVKLETGHIDLVRLGNGTTVAIPGSIAFDKIGEPEMIEFFQSAETWLAKTYNYCREAPAA